MLRESDWLEAVRDMCARLDLQLCEFRAVWHVLGLNRAATSVINGGSDTAKRLQYHFKVKPCDGALLAFLEISPSQCFPRTLTLADTVNELAQQRRRAKADLTVKTRRPALTSNGGSRKGCRIDSVVRELRSGTTLVC